MKSRFGGEDFHVQYDRVSRGSQFLLAIGQIRILRNIRSYTEPLSHPSPHLP